MATITLNQTVYNNAKKYAESQNLSVDEFIVSLINKFVPHKRKKKYQMKSIGELSPELRSIIGFAKPTYEEVDDINGDIAREEYLAEKFSI